MNIQRITFDAAYFITGSVSMIVGALGTIFPFGILGDLSRFDSDDLGSTEVELMTCHLARICHVTTLFLGFFFLSFGFADGEEKENIRNRAKLLAMSNLASIICSLGDILIDAPRASRLGIDISKPDEYSRSLKFLIGCLDGGSLGTLAIAVAVLLVSIPAVMTPELFISEEQSPEQPPHDKDD